MKNEFTRIYRNQEWGEGTDEEFAGSSGHGSNEHTCKRYVDFISTFLANNRIESVVDIGCGDWAIGKQLYLESEIRYLGVDIYEEMIQVLQRRHGNLRIGFHCEDVSISSNYQSFKPDIYIVKDVLQHWPDLYVENFLERHRSDRMLLINDANQDGIRDIDIGGHAPLSPALLPLRNFGGTVIHSFGDGDGKIAVLLNG